MAQSSIRIRLKASTTRSSISRRARSSRRSPAPTPPSVARSRCRPTSTATRSSRGPHIDKDSREHFEMRVHKRLIDIVDPNAKTIDSLQRIELPAGVDIEIKIQSS